MIDIDKILACLFVGIASLSILHLLLQKASNKRAKQDVRFGQPPRTIKATDNVRNLFEFDHEHFIFVGPIVITVGVYLYLVDSGGSNLTEKAVITFLSIMLFLQGVRPAKTLFASAFVAFASLTVWPIYVYIESGLPFLLAYSAVIAIVSYFAMYFLHRQRDDSEPSDVSNP